MCEALESGPCFYGLEQKLRHVRGERKEELFLAQLSGQSANMTLIFVPAHKNRDESQIPKPHILENPHLLPTIVHRAFVTDTGRQMFLREKTQKPIAKDDFEKRSHLSQHFPGFYGALRHGHGTEGLTK